MNSETTSRSLSWGFFLLCVSVFGIIGYTFGTPSEPTETTLPDIYEVRDTIDRVKVEEHIEAVKQVVDERDALQQEVEALTKEGESLRKRIEDTSRQIEETERIIKERESNPYNFNESEIDLLYRLVEAESGGESITGRIAVANVILNRIRSDKYPNNLRDVIYQKNQFEVVSIGTIDTKVPSEGTKEAVQRALNGEKAVSDKTVIFWAKYLDKGHAIWKHCPIVKTIGVHHFAESWNN